MSIVNIKIIYLDNPENGNLYNIPITQQPLFTSQSLPALTQFIFPSLDKWDLKMDSHENIYVFDFDETLTTIPVTTQNINELDQYIVHNVSDKISKIKGDKIILSRGRTEVIYDIIKKHSLREHIKYIIGSDCNNDMTYKNIGENEWSIIKAYIIEYIHNKNKNTNIYFYDDNSMNIQRVIELNNEKIKAVLVSNNQNNQNNIISLLDNVIEQQTISNNNTSNIFARGGIYNKYANRYNVNKSLYTTLTN